MLLKVNKALKGISELKNREDVTAEELEKIPTMERVINKLLDKIHKLCERGRGKHCVYIGDAARADSDLSPSRRCSKCRRK